MDNKQNGDIMFGKAIGQVIHDVRNSLNTIIGFSSLLQMNNKIDKEIKSYLKKIHFSGMEIEKQLMNIDYYMMNEISIEKKDINLKEMIKNYLSKNAEHFEEMELIIQSEHDDINYHYSPELLNHIFDNLVTFSIKGLKSTKLREINFLFKDTSTAVELYYSDSSTPVFIENDYFTFDEVIKSKRGLGVMFAEKYIINNHGQISYLYGKKWQTKIMEINPNNKHTHGFILTFPK